MLVSSRAVCRIRIRSNQGHDDVEQTAFVVDRNRGLLLTASHGLENIVPGTTVRVTAPGFRTANPIYHGTTPVFPARVVLENQLANLVDCTVLKATDDGQILRDYGMGELQVLPGLVTVGDVVFAVGFPFDVNHVAITDGIVSGLNTMGNNSWGYSTTLNNKGMSGGPLVTPTGEVVGMIIRIYHGNHWHNQGLCIFLTCHYLDLVMGVVRAMPL